MADQNITALPKKTSSQLAATDYLLGIDSAEGYQMLIQDLGDYIIQHATSSLAGSNQTLASAITALNSNFASKNYTVFNTTTLLTTQVDALPVKASYCGVISSYNHVEETGVPVNAAGYVEIYSESVNYKRLFFCPMGSTDVYVKDKSSNGWGDWVKIPTRSEVDALNNRTTFSQENPVGSSSNATFSLNQGKTNGQVCVVTFNATTTEQINAYSEFILLNEKYIPSGSDTNLFASTVVGTENEIMQWQVMRTGYIRPGVIIPANTNIRFSLVYIKS